MKFGHQTTTSTLRQALVFISSLLMMNVTLANPVLDNVAAGQVSVQQAPNSTVVNQSSQQAIINWNSFNIGAAEKTHFEQPAGGVALNRINPTQGASQIYGQLSATGKIILVNQAGIFFGPGSRVDVGGIIASTSDISDANFLAGKYNFDRPSAYNGSIINQGVIHAAENGLVALVGTGVRNDGTIEAHAGSVVLASGNKFTIDLYGDQLVNFSVDEAATSAGVDHQGNKLSDGVRNDGVIVADGGTIIMSARAARGVVDNVVNMKGVAQARSVSEKDGVIILEGGDGNVSVSGKVDVSGTTQYARGGKVKVLANKVHIEKTAVIDASGNAGGGEILIGGNYQGKGPEQNAYSTQVDHGAIINADAIQHGNGGKVIVWADNDTLFSGSISARGGSEGGDGGFVETSGKKYLSVASSFVDLRAPLGKTGTWLLDPENLTIQTSGTTTASFAANTYTSNVDSSILTVADLEAALNSASIIVQTGAGGAELGNITVANAISWDNSNSLTLSAHNNIYVNAGISNNAGGSLNLTALNAIQINSPITLTGGTLTLSAANTASSITTADTVGTVNVTNFNLASGQWTQTSASNPSFYVANDFQLANGTTFIRNMGTTLISGTPYNVIADVYGLQGIATQSMSNNYALSQDVDATVTANWNSGAGFSPIGSYAVPFTGNLDGQNFIVDGLTINRPSLGFAGLFAAVNLGANSISNIGLTNVNIYSGGNTTGALGIVAGYLYSGTLSHVFTTGTLTQAAAGGCTVCGVGGLVGILNNAAGLIQDSYNLASVTGADYAAGGLVGYNIGIVNRSYNGGAVSAPYEAGGLAGELDHTGTITNSYNFGSVTSNNFAGGLVGAAYNEANVITNSYASGLVTSLGSAGGLIAINYGTLTINNSFWDTNTTGQANASQAGALPGATGLTTAQALVQDNYTGWDFSTIWFTPSYASNTSAAYTRPILRSEYSTTIRNGHQLQLIAMDGSQTYTLGNDIDLSNIVNKADIWGTDVSSGNGFISLGTFLADSSKFNGVLDGNGHVIDHLYMRWNYTTAPANTSPALFTLVDAGAVVQNIGLTNVDISSTVSNNGSGPFAYWLSGTLQRAFATGTVHLNVDSGQGIPGGLVSSVTGGAIIDSYSTVNVSFTATGPVAGIDVEVGGLAGRVLFGGSVTNSYSTGSVTAPADTGFNSYGVGGLIGSDWGGSTFSNNFWNINTSGQATSVGATGLTSAQMMQQSNFTGWDFSNTGAWAIVDNSTNPLLQSIYTLVSGTATGVTGTVGFAVNGLDMGASYDTAISSGAFYQIFRTTDIASNSTILASINSGTSNAVTVQQNSGNAISGLSLVANGLTIGDGATKTISNTQLSQARGVLVNNDILYYGAGSDLTLGNSVANTVALSTAAQTTFNIDGNISEYTGATSSYSFSGPVNIYNVSVVSSGTQTYNSAVTLASAAASLSTTSGNIVFNGGITGVGSSLTLAGGNNQSNSFTLTNAISLANLTINGGTGTGTNVLNLQTNSASQDWSITGADAGSIALTGITGTFGFSHLQNLVGGSNADNFTLNGGGTLSGSIDGGSGVNTFIVPAGTTSWVINGTNAGTVNGVTSGFSNIQNLTGGTGLSVFTFTGNGTISGVIDGGNMTFVNTLDFSGYAQPVALTLDIPAGNIFNSGSIGGMGTFTQIQKAIGTPGGASTLTLPNKPNITVNYADGSIGDPFYFVNLTLINAPAIPAAEPVPEVVPSFVTQEISKVVTPFQGDTNNTVLLQPITVVQSMYVAQIITDVIEKEVSLDTELKEKQSFGCFK